MSLLSSLLGSASQPAPSTAAMLKLCCVGSRDKLKSLNDKIREQFRQLEEEQR